METILSVIAIIASGISLWQSYQAQTFSAALALTEKRQQLIIEMLNIHRQLLALHTSVPVRDDFQVPETALLLSDIHKTATEIFNSFMRISNDTKLDAIKAESLKSYIHVKKIEIEDFTKRINAIENKA